MRLGLLLEQLVAPVPGGTGRYTAELAAALVRTAHPQNHITGWTAWHRDGSAARLDGVESRRLPAPRRALVAAWERGRGPVPHRVDVLHAPTPLFPPRTRPLVVSVHDAVPWTHPQTLTIRGVQWHRRMVGLAAAQADVIAVPTQAVADELLTFVPALDRNRIVVLGAGVSRALSEEPSAAECDRIRRHYRLAEPFILSVATLEPRKGLDVLIDAMGLIGGDAPQLVVVGQPGWGGLDLAALAARAHLSSEQVKVLGRVPDAELNALLRMASAVIVPSRAEGFGLPVVEAMAVGTPVICTDVPALVEVAGSAAVVVAREDPSALGEVILRVVNDFELAQQLGEAGRLRARLFDWDDVARRAWQVYHRLA